MHKHNKLERWATVKNFRLCIALCEYKSIVHAANAINISQPTASKILIELERNLKMKLFTRTGRGVEATSLGIAFTEKAKVMLAQLDKFSNELEYLNDGHTRYLSIGVILTGSSYRLPIAIMKLLDSFPLLKIKVTEGTSSELTSKLISGEVDFLLGRLLDIKANSHLEQEALFIENAVIITGAKNITDISNEITLEELVDKKWLLPSFDTHLTRQFCELFSSNDISPPEATVETTSLNNIMFMLSKGDYYGVIPSSIAENFHDKEQFITLKNIQPLTLSRIGITKKKNNILSIESEILIDELRNANI